jgi:hypothetical protein
MFKLQINLDRHNAGLKFSYFLRFDLPNFSLPSTFKMLGVTRTVKKGAVLDDVALHR